MSILSDLFKAQMAIVKSDLAKDVIPEVQQANNLIASNPTILNVIAQAQKIVVDVKAEAPQLLQDEIKELAQFVNSELQKLAAPAPNSGK